MYVCMQLCCKLYICKMEDFELYKYDKSQGSIYQQSNFQKSCNIVENDVRLSIKDVTIQ